MKLKVGASGHSGVLAPLPVVQAQELGADLVMAELLNLMDAQDITKNQSLVIPYVSFM